MRFEVTEPLVSAGYCHCTRCQRRTGTAASASASVAPSSFRLLSGTEAVRGFRPPDGRVKVFCGECGSALWSEDRDDPEKRSVRLGAFDADPGIRPSARSFVDFAASWESIPDDGLPRFGGPRSD